MFFLGLPPGYVLSLPHLSVVSQLFVRRRWRKEREMDPVSLVGLLLGAATFLGLELWSKAQLGAVVCPLGQNDRSQTVLTAVVFAVGGAFIFTALSSGYPSDDNSAWVSFATGVTALETGVYFLLKARWIGARLGEGGLQPIYGRVIRWRDITSCQWAGKESCELILERIAREGESGRVTFSVAPAHKATVERSLTQHLPWEKRIK